MEMQTFIDRPTIQSCKQLSCHIVPIDVAMYYNGIWHSRLPITNKGNMLRNPNVAFFGALYDLSYYAVAMWTTPVAANRMKNGKNILELRRLAIAPDAPRYTATWMISKMVKHIKNTMPHIWKLISYQDTDVHTGTIYAAANWTLETKSEYQAWSTSHRQRKSKVQSTAAKNRWAYVINAKEVE